MLERLPTRTSPALARLNTLRAASAQAPNDLARAVALATASIRASRLEGDPRYLGHAQAALAPWWKDRDAPTPVLLLRATILQSSHRFAPAIADLDRVLAREPGQAQALLTRATVLTVQGRYTEARGDCERLRDKALEVFVAACIAAIDSVTGKAAAAYESLQQTLARAGRLDAVGRAWVETLLGEIAHRRGDPAAERHFTAALRTGERDSYLLGAYSDWLLDQDRAADVVALLRGESRIDALLLRLALAQAALHSPDAAASGDALRQRFEASQARGDTTHEREHARFELALGGDTRRALALALDNWKTQREAADLRVLAEAAAAAHDATALSLVAEWLAQTRFEYPAVAALVAGGPPRR